MISPAPRFLSCATRCVPTKPLPPVTMIFCCCQSNAAMSLSVVDVAGDCSMVVDAFRVPVWRALRQQKRQTAAVCLRDFPAVRTRLLRARAHGGCGGQHARENAFHGHGMAADGAAAEERASAIPGAIGEGGV